MKEIIGTGNKILEIDLSKKSVEVYEVEPGERRLYLGRQGFGPQAALRPDGGASFAMHVKGLELAGYDPRGSYGQGLAFAVANRGGCHLSAFLAGQEVFLRLLKPYAIRSKADYVKFFESLDNCVNSLQTCLFTLFAYLLEPPLTKYTPNFMLALLMQELPRVAIALIDFSLYKDLWCAVTGISLSRRDYLEAGDRITVLERYMNTREGTSQLHDTLPERLLKEGRISDPRIRTVPLEKLRAAYYKKRGYDHNGIPTPRTLDRLGIEAG